MRNSNLLPVKAKGEVRLRSVSSLVTEGIASTPMSHLLARNFVGTAALSDVVEDAGQMISQEKSR